MKSQGFMNKKVQSGFTLVELLIVIAVIAILAAVAFVAIDPATRINEAQDSERWSAVNALMDSFLQSTVDNDGTYPGSMSADGVTYMITSGTTSAACSVTAGDCTASQCVGLGDLATEGYIASLPNDPDGTTGYGGGTGYTISVATNGIVTVASCGDEEDTIQVGR